MCGMYVKRAYGARGSFSSLLADRLVPVLLLIFITFAVAVGVVGGEEAYTGGGYPESSASSGYDSIWRADSGNSPSNTSVTFTLSGSGAKGITLAPQDVVFVMDHSGSLETEDPGVLRIRGAQRYVDNMVAPFDRAAILKFDTTAALFNHLSAAQPQVKADLDALAKIQPQGQTNFQAAISLMNDELIVHGIDGNQKIGIVFSDGSPDPPEKNVTLETMNVTRDNGIKLYTIGLGTNVDTGLMGWMAAYTGGEFYWAHDAQELEEIYLKISNQFYNFTAGSNCTLVLEMSDDINYVDGSSNITGGLTVNRTEAGDILTFDIGRIMIDETWSVQFRIESPDGEGTTRVFEGASELRYADWRGENRTADVPDLFINVIRALPPPLPPPPPPPPAVAPAPIPPPPSVPVVAPSVNVAPVITATPNITPVTVGQAATVPVEYMLAGLATLGLAERTAIKKTIIEKQKVSVGE